MEVSGPRITEWKDNKETLNDEDDDEAFDEVDDDDDDNVTTITYKDLFRMATLGGATGTLKHRLHDTTGCLTGCHTGLTTG